MLDGAGGRVGAVVSQAMWGLRVPNQNYCKVELLLSTHCGHKPLGKADAQERLNSPALRGYIAQRR
jgi:hypothetical protein